MTDRVATVLATWFGCGRVPRAPGTAGTLGALPLYFAVASAGAWGVLAAAAVVTAVGVWAAGQVARRLENPDPQIVCIDEVAGVLLPLAVAPRDGLAIGAAVIFFRIFDVIKPWPARSAERLPRGWGVMSDDLVAGAWAAAVVWLVWRGPGA